MTRRAHCSRRVFVRMKSVYLAIGFACAIDVWLTGLGAAAYSAQPILPGLQRNQRSIFLHTCLQFLPRTRPVAGHHEFVVARQHQFDWRFSLFGKFTGELSFDSDTKLRAEAPTHVLHL